MIDRYTIDEILALAQSPERPPAWEIKERLGLRQSVRQVQRLIHSRLGPRPTRRAIERRDVLRDAVVYEMERGGLDRHYCLEGHHSLHPCLVRKIHPEPGVGSLAFVCRKHGVAGDC
jgi:hypothetical protein